MKPYEEYLTPEEEEELVKSNKERELMLRRIQGIMQTEGFSEFINLLLDISNFNGNNYTTDNSLLSYMEGRRSVFCDVLAVLEDCDATFYPGLLIKRSREK